MLISPKLAIAKLIKKFDLLSAISWELGLHNLHLNKLKATNICKIKNSRREKCFGNHNEIEYEYTYFIFSVHML